MKYVGGTWWELQLADGWSVVEHPECLTIASTDSGAFQLSAAVKAHGVISSSEVETQCREGTPANAKAFPVEAGEFLGLTVGYEQENTHWQRFWLANGSLLVFATYNGLHNAWRSEQSAVYAMLASLRLRATANVAAV
jgi:hypothetical protein